MLWVNSKIYRGIYPSISVSLPPKILSLSAIYPIKEKSAMLASLSNHWWTTLVLNLSLWMYSKIYLHIYPSNAEGSSWTASCFQILFLIGKFEGKKVHKIISSPKKSITKKFRFQGVKKGLYTDKHVFNERSHNTFKFIHYTQRFNLQ